MKVTVTHLKAPWPAGTLPGHVVELAADTVPGWAVGKCVPAADDAPVTLPAPAVSDLVVNPAKVSEEDAAAAAALAAAEAQAAEERAAIEAAEAEAAAKAAAEAQAAEDAKAAAEAAKAAKAAAKAAARA